MKIKIIFSVLLVLAVVGFYFSKPTAKENENNSFPPPTTLSLDTFLIGAYCDAVFSQSTIKNELGFNLWQRYLGTDSNHNHRYEPTGWTDNDNLTDTSLFITEVKTQILNPNENYGLKTFMCRPKIEWLTFGQRSDYQCEDVSYLADSLKDYWFYTYRN